MINIKSIREFLIASSIKHRYIGSDFLNIETYSLPDNIKNNSILWIKDPGRIKDCNITNYSDVLIVTSAKIELDTCFCNYLISDNSKELFFYILNHFFSEPIKRNFIGKRSTIETLHIGKNVYIGENCYISPKVVINDNVIINNNVVIEGDVIIGNDTIIYSGVVIGSDGYGYYKNSEGKNMKVPHLGGVIIGNDVEIGANTCIDRGTLGDTIIEDNVKIDNLCHIAHNVRIERNVNVIALSMIAGSVILKENSYIAPSASVMNQITIGKNSIVGIGSVVLENVDDNLVVVGVPAKVIRKLGEE